MKFRIVRYVKKFQDVVIEAETLDDAFEAELPADDEWSTFDRDVDITSIVEVPE